MTAYDDLLIQLSGFLGANLRADENQSCLLQFKDDVAIQIDLDSNADMILVASTVGHLFPGRYRENVFAQAMRVNGLSRMPRGVLSFSEKKEVLVLFEFLYLATLNGEKLWNFLQLFHQHALAWKAALTRGEIPQLQEDESTTGSGMFGLRP